MEMLFNYTVGQTFVNLFIFSRTCTLHLNPYSFTFTNFQHHLQVSNKNNVNTVAQHTGKVKSQNGPYNDDCSFKIIQNNS